jgi:hypothetical protein
VSRSDLADLDAQNALHVKADSKLVARAETKNEAFRSGELAEGSGSATKNQSCAISKMGKTRTHSRTHKLRAEKESISGEARSIPLNPHKATEKESASRVNFYWRTSTNRHQTIRNESRAEQV